MEPRSISSWNAQTYQAACEWFIEFRTAYPSEDTRRRFLAWLQEAPSHMGAYLEVTALWNQSEAVDAKLKWSIEALVEQAGAQPDNVVPLASGSTFERDDSFATNASADSARNSRMLNRGPVGRFVAAAAFLLMLAPLLIWLGLQRDTYATLTGEQRLMTLPDGSTVQLNARSKIRVRFTTSERYVDLMQGQALFEVAKNPQRPFVVASGGTRVRAVGTQFDVHRKGTGTVVTVIEGRVAVHPESLGSLLTSKSTQVGKQRQAAAGAGPDAAPEVLLSAGQQLTVTPRIVSKSEHANIASATGWTKRQFVFESTPLAEVVEEFNRYNPKQLVVKDRALDEFQIDGVFSSASPAPLIEFLRSRSGIRVIERDAEIVIEKDSLP